MYYYQNVHKKKNMGILKKLIIQLAAIFTIMLFLILTKYIPGDYAKKALNGISTAFYDDMTKNVVDVFNKYSPDVKNYFDNIFNKSSSGSSVILNLNFNDKIIL